MKLYIPALGDHLRLTAPWSFRLYGEYRNESLFKHLVLPFEWNFGRDMKKTMVTLPAGTELGIDRIYIRRGNKDFDSITFNLLGVKGRGRVRFWAKLSDVNTIEFESLLTNLHLSDD